MFDLVSILNENPAVVNDFWNKAGPIISKHIDQSFQKGKILFGCHLDSSLKKNSFVKLLSSKSTPIPLKEVYVQNYFICEGGEPDPITDLIFIEDIRQGMRVVIRGNGGTGKTFFLKYFWSQIFDDPRGTIPVFVELRKFNKFSDMDLEAFIKYTITNGEGMDDAVFNSLLKSGSFVIMFDGFDELVKSKRPIIEKQILTLEEKCPNCPIVVSSRANAIFEGWTNFHIYDVVGFSYLQVRELVSKSTVDNETKSAFSSVLDEEFYIEHETFLEIPLLALMMLMTFRDTANIPENIDAFYSAVFLTLYQNHDAIKESLVREKYLGLVELQRFFAVFCFITYAKENYEFTKLEILEEIEIAIDFLNDHTQYNTKISCTPEEILNDLEESVNLICLDGLTYLFVHRSFQEYFTAYFVIKMEEAKTQELLLNLGLRFSDNVLQICYQMKPATVISKYIIPKYNEFLNNGAFSKVTHFKNLVELQGTEKVFLAIFSNNQEAHFDIDAELYLDFHIGKPGDWSNFAIQLQQFSIPELGTFNLSKNYLNTYHICAQKFSNENSMVGKEFVAFFTEFSILDVYIDVGAKGLVWEGYTRNGETDERMNLTENAVGFFTDQSIKEIEEILLDVGKAAAADRIKIGNKLKLMSDKYKKMQKNSFLDLYGI